MAENDEVSGSESADTPYVPTGPRRSTFTPPSGGYSPQFVQPDDAEGEQLTGRAEQAQAGSAPERPEIPQPEMPQPESGQDEAARPGPDVASPPDAQGAPSAVPVVTPAELPDRPRRRSLQDDELLRSLAPKAEKPASTLATIEQLQAELQLRDQEAREFSAWENRMRAIGTPEALESIAEAIPEFTGVIPIIPPQPGPVDAKAEAPEAAVPTPEAGSFLHPEEFPPPRLEERVDAGPPQEQNLSDHLVFQPPWMKTPSDGAQPTAGFEQAAQEVETLEEPDAAEQAEVPEPSEVSEPSELVEPEALDPEASELPESVDAGSPPADATPDAPIVYDLVDPISQQDPQAAPPPSPFDALLSGDANPAPEDEEARPFSLLHTPQDAEPVQTGSQAVLVPLVDSEPDDDVDETDRAFGDLVGPFPVTSEGVAILPPTTGSAPIQPVSTPRVATDEQVVMAAEPTRTRVFSLELSGEEASLVERRAGRAARMFWLWFATNSSVVSVAFGAALFGLGMSLRQAILAAFVGVAISFLPLGLGTLAGKWSGQPTIVVSRATFGLAGNIVPALLALLTRLFWGAVLLWLISVCTARILVGASLGGPFDEAQLSFIAAAGGFVIALLVAFFGYPLFARLQLVLSIASAVLIVGLLVVTWHVVDIRAALTVGDGPWMLLVTGVVLVFSFVGLVWANSSGDIARYQRPGGSGAAASLWASFGATLPAFLLIAYGALLAASGSATSDGLLKAPLDTIARMIPSWYPMPLLAATALSLLSGVALSLYSGGFALQAVGVRLRRHWAVVAVGIVLFGITVLVIVSGTGIAGVFRDFATSLAVPVAAWAGIFAAEVMIRRKRFDEASLLSPGGVYPSVNWVNLAMLFVASAIGFAFTSATVGWLSWQGYGFALLGFPTGGEVAASDLGVLVALAIGLLTPLVAGIPTVRRQERS